MDRGKVQRDDATLSDPPTCHLFGAAHLPSGSVPPKAPPAPPARLPPQPKEEEDRKVRHCLRGRKTVETQQKGGVLAAQAAETQGKGTVLERHCLGGGPAVEAQQKGSGWPPPASSSHSGVDCSRWSTQAAASAPARRAGPRPPRARPPPRRAGPGPARPPELKLNIPALVFCMRAGVPTLGSEGAAQGCVTRNSNSRYQPRCSV